MSPSLPSPCHMALSICSKQTHPRLLRLASKELYFWQRACLHSPVTEELENPPTLVGKMIRHPDLQKWGLFSEECVIKSSLLPDPLRVGWSFPPKGRESMANVFLLCQNGVKTSTPSLLECLTCVTGSVLGLLASVLDLILLRDASVRCSIPLNFIVLALQ